MSQDSKKPISLPVRKRLKPTVNLNVASRRRKDTKDTPSVTDVLPEQPENKINSNHDHTKEDTLHRPNDVKESNNIEAKEGENVLNTTFESEKSFSSTRTVLLQNVSENVHCGVQEKTSQLASDSRSSPRKSVSSSVSTVLLPNNQHDSASKKESKNLLEQSVDSLDELEDCGTSNITLENSSTMTPRACETGQNEFLNVRDDSAKSVMSLDQCSHSDRAVNDHKKSVETSSHHSENESRKSSSEVPAGLPKGDQRMDIESLNDDSMSTVSDCSSLQQDGDMAPPKYRRKTGSMAKRLSEARRDFEARFCHKKPERSALRMFDLIYYNPSTNPMKSTPDKPKEVVVSPPPSELDSSPAVEEDVDNPAEEENLEDDNDNGMPAPRVKVGPNGEIVLDEQSLVIETTQSKKSRQEIANLTVVVDTGSNTTYHTYSKKKRIRSDWTVKETVRFYKALQTLGTDFSLMQTLFPSRSRLDLKSKFKKEERINGHLIEKALRFPSLFDLSELEKEQTNEEKKESKTKKQKPPKKRESKRSLKSLGFDEEDIGPPVVKKKKQGVKTLYPRNSGKDTGKENVETHPECTLDEEYHPPAGEQAKNEGPKGGTERRSTRVLNGKTPNYAALENKHDFLEAGVDLLESSETEEENDVEEESAVGDEDPPTLTNGFDMNNVQPGSLVIVTAQHPDNPGYQICNVFMVQERSDTGDENVEPPSTANFSIPGTLMANPETVIEPS